MKLDASASTPSRRSPAPGPAAEPPHPHARVLSLLLALITVLVYLPAGFHGFIDLDDPEYVAENPVVEKGLTWEGFKWAFVGWHASNWHPLTWLSHEMDCQLFGLAAGGHHFVNILFHAANAVLLFLVWLRLTKSCWPSAFIAALFAWHPLHVESVAWVAERKDVLSTFFGLLALLYYGRYAEEKKANPAATAHSSYWVALGCFALGLLAKPMLVTLPFVLLLLDYWPLRRLPGGRGALVQMQRLLWEKWPFFLLAVGSCVMTVLAQRRLAMRTLGDVSLPARLENVVVAYVRYLGKIFCPIDLSIYYPLAQTIPVAKVLAAALTLAVISLLAWRWRGRGYFLVGWLWFLGMLVPVIGLVQVGTQAMADRYTYLPAIGIFVAVAFGVAEAWSKWALSSRALWMGGAALLAGCVAATEYQLSFWPDSQTLFKHALALDARNAEARMLLGADYENHGDHEAALREYAAALGISPTLYIEIGESEVRPLSAQVQFMLGRADEQKGDAPRAIAHYREALRLDGGIVEAHNNLGNLLDASGQSAAALVEYAAAVKLQPQAPLVHENLGTQFAEMGRLDEAMLEYRIAAHLAPADPHPAYLMGKAWLRNGQSAQAAGAFDAALRIDANDISSLVWLARVLASDQTASVRDGARAVALAERANELTGGSQPTVLGALAMAYAENQRFEDAQKVVQRALLQAGGANQETVSNLQAQLRLYRAHQPFRETFANPLGK